MITILGRGLLFALAVAFSMPAWSATAAYMSSPSGEYIGQGQDYQSAAVTASYNANSRSVTVDFDGWEANFQAPSGETLVAGNYEGATRWPFNSAVEPGLSVTSPGRGCNRVAGWFEIHEIAVAGSTVTKLAVDLLQSCDGQAPLFGAIRVGSDVPLQRPEPYARSVRSAAPTEGDEVVLDGSLSFDRSSEIASFAWTQVQGPAVALADETTPHAHFTAPDVAPGGATLAFQLTVTDADGNTDSTIVNVVVSDVADPRTRAFVDSAAGDWVGQGLAYWYDESDASIRVDPLGSVLRVQIEGHEQWTAEFALPQGAAWQPGTYGGAQRYPFQSSSEAGLDFSGEGRGCNQLSGWFEVVEIQVVGSSVMKLAVDFEQHCDGGPALFGAIRYNSNVPLDRQVPYAIAPAGGSASEGEEGTLDGSASTSRSRPLTYEWTQIGGPAATITDPHSAIAHFTAPAVPPGGATLTFQLTVTDAAGHSATTTVTVHVYDSGDPRTRALIQSSAGDWVGAGRTYAYDEANAQIATTGPSNVLSVQIKGPETWSASFALPSGASWQPGTYAGARRYPFQPPRRPGLDFSGEGRGCNQLTGWFEISELQVVGNSLMRLAIDFVQYCDGGPPLFGAIRYNSGVPIDPSRIVAIAGADIVVQDRAPIALDGRESWSAGRQLTYSWTQIDGPPARIRYPYLAWTELEPLSRAPSGGTSSHFQLTVTDETGQSDSDVVEVRILSDEDPQTYITIDSEAGDYVGQGRSWHYLSEDSTISLSRNYDNGINVYIDGDTWWSISLAAPDGWQIGTGTYPGAQRFPFQDAGRPGLDYSGDGRGCNTLTGSFQALDLAYESDGSVKKAAIDFEQHCEGASAAARGMIRVNFAPKDDPERYGLILSAVSLNFGSHLVGTSVARELTLGNATHAPLALHEFTITGDYYSKSATTCPASLAPGGTCTVTVVFTPGAGGPHTGTLTLNTSSPNGSFDVRLTGVGVSPVDMKASAFITVAPAKPGKNKVQAQATLLDGTTKAPLAGRSITFAANGRTLCASTTNSAGKATCGADAAAVDTLLDQGYQATFAGDSLYEAKTVNGKLTKAVTP